MRTNFFCTNFLNTPKSPGTSRQNSRDIPDYSLRNPRKTNFRVRARTFRPPPLRVEDPHPTGRSPDPKSYNLCALFSCLNNTKTTILGATPGAILGIDGHKHERFSFEPAFSGAVFQEWGGPRARIVVSISEAYFKKTLQTYLLKEA